MAKFVANKDVNKTHEIVLNKMFSDAVQLDWQIAFASVNGVNAIHDNFLNFIKSNNSHTARITIGLDYYHSEPDALDFFFNLSKKYPSQIEFYVSNPDGEYVFHPKAYVFHCTTDDDKFARVLIGSANLTSGGLDGNYEFSAQILLKFDGNGENTFLSDFENHSQEIIDAEEVVLANKQILERYREEHKYYHLYSALAKKKVKSAITRGDIDPYEYFRVILEEFKSEVKCNFDSQIQDRFNRRGNAIKILNGFVAKKGWNKVDFFEKYNLLVSNPFKYFSSGEIERQRSFVANDYVNFINGLDSLERQFSLVNKLSPSIAYDTLLKHFILNKKNKAIGVHGAGVNIMTEILHAYDNGKYAVMNSLSVQQLNLVSSKKFPIDLDKSKITGNMYQDFCDEAEKVCTALGLKNFTEFDALMNYNYWN